MFLLDNYGLAVAFCLVTMICWGSWVNTTKLADKTWRFELFNWDYTIGILFLSLVLAFTFGNTGTQGRSFLDDIVQADFSSIRSALIGGAVKAPIGNPFVLFGGVGLVAIVIILNALAYRRLNRSSQKIPSKDLILAVISGLMMGMFYGFSADSTAKDFSTPESGLLTPYTAVVFFSLGIFVSNFIFNTILMRVPIDGASLSRWDYCLSHPHPQVYTDEEE